MPYTGHPDTVVIDEVRLLVGDTSRTSELLSNVEYQYFLDDENDNVRRAAARAAEALEAKFSGEADSKQVGPLKISLENKAGRYRELASSMWSSATGATVAPFAGGISRSDKAAREANGDRVQPKFKKNMQEYPLGANHVVGTSGEILS